MIIEQLTKKNIELKIMIFSSILITLFLFYIDEGYYNFKWAKNSLNWIFFLMYMVPILLGQLFISKFIPKKFTLLENAVLSIFFGSTLGTTLVISLFYLIK